jgi:hypothetical protein
MRFLESQLKVVFPFDEALLVAMGNHCRIVPAAGSRDAGLGAALGTRWQQFLIEHSAAKDAQKATGSEG